MKGKPVKNNILISIFFLLILLSVGSTAKQSAQFMLPQDSRVPGGLAVISLDSSNTEKSVVFNGQKVWQLSDDNHNNWAVIGIPLNQKAGKVDYTIDGKRYSFMVKDKTYKEQYLTVKRKHSNPPTDQIKRIQEESRLSKKAFTTFSNTRESKRYRGFLKPAQGPTSSPFGLKRFFNEQPRRPHSGIDIAAPRGSDIIAPADGIIILTGNFFFNGNSLFIDHGQGLITLYCHMDVLERKQGDSIKAGEVIGKVGSTGRVTGPHLHWTVSLNNSRVEPLLFFSAPAL
ncbi:MAG: murein DD-endopeptidase MepM/ murein hydrolase activator NlpD [Parvicella sp.]|jgi:murein DD-endopeptidase MepM/ murein hydrolase activator NlpD